MIEDYVVIDLEMTGLKVKTDAILEVGAVRVRQGSAADTYSALLYTDKPLPEEVSALTGITPEMAENGRDPEEVMAEFFAFLGEDTLVGQNVMFDYSFLKQWAVNHDFTFERNAVDTLKIARHFLPAEQKKDLVSLCVYFSIGREHVHRALDDALATHQLLECLKERYGETEEAAFLPKQLCYKVKKQMPATPRQLAYLKRYAQYYGIELPPQTERLNRSEVSRLTDRLIAQYGRMVADPAREE